jgi:ligand-binding sensor domain-containing protein
MIPTIKLIYLFLILSLCFSCAEQPSAVVRTNKQEVLANAKSDTLKFTSGIRAIFQDRNGNYWLGSHSEGVCFYDGKSFEYFTTLDGLADNQVRSIQEDEHGKIWIGTARGVSVYDNGKWTTYATRSNHPITDWNSVNGDLWFYAGEEDGINRFDGTQMNYLIFPKPANVPADNTYGVTDISKDKSGKIWIATYSALFSYDDKVVHRFDDEKLKLKNNEHLHIRSVLADSKGSVWIGNNGIGVLLMEDDSIIHFSERENLIHPTSTRRGDPSSPGTLEHVFAIEEDAAGTIWFGDRDTGAWSFDGNAMTNHSMSDKLPHPMIWTIYKDNQNNLLFGLADGNIYKFDGKVFRKVF